MRVDQESEKKNKNKNKREKERDRERERKSIPGLATSSDNPGRFIDTYSG